MKQIDVSTPKHPGVFALVDDEDYERVSQHKWSAEVRKNVTYAARNFWSGGKGKTVRLHQFVMDAKPGEQFDHADRNGLNNQKANLRRCTHQQNSANVEKIDGDAALSRFKGVSWCKRFKCWVAVIKVDGKTKKIGNFDTELAAAAHYDEAATAKYREFACTNGIAMSEEFRSHRRPFRNGEKSNFANLTEDDVRRIRADSRSQAVIARDFGVTQTSISLIKRRVNWRHVE